MIGTLYTMIVGGDAPFGGIGMRKPVPEPVLLVFPSLDHLPELVEANLVVAGGITSPEDPVRLSLVHVLHHLEEQEPRDCSFVEWLALQQSLTTKTTYSVCHHKVFSNPRTLMHLNLIDGVARISFLPL